MKRAFFINSFNLNCDNYTTKRINMQEEFRIFFATGIVTGDWVSDIRYQTRQAREAGHPLIVDAISARMRNEE